MDTKTAAARMRHYRDLQQRWQCDEAFVAEVIGRGGEVGYTEEFATPYTGPAGRSSRLRVIWGDGSVTLCCVKGMRGSQPDERKPGGFRVWTIA